MPVKKQNIGSSQPATKGDIEQVREDVHLDVELAVQASEKRVNAHTDQKIAEARQEISQSKEEILHEFRAAVELIRSDLAGANKDEISLIKDQQRNHTKRITRLEQRTSLA